MVHPDDVKWPRSWQQASLDVKLMYVYAIGTMLVFMFGRLFPIAVSIGTVGLLLVGLVTVSAIHRRRSGWRWPGLKIKTLVGGLIGFVFVLFFFVAATQRLSPLNPNVFGWFAFGGGILFVGVLASLNLFVALQSDFEKQCSSVEEPTEPATATSKESTWRKVVRQVLGVYVSLVMIVGVTYFYKYNSAWTNASPQPTPQQSVPLTEHQTTVFITPEEADNLQHLLGIAVLGGLSAAALVVVSHFVLGVKMFATTSSMAKLD